MRFRSVILPAAFAFLLVGCAEGQQLETVSIPQTPQVHRLGNLYTAGQPTPGGLTAARDLGIRRVINLRKDVEMPFDEAQAAADLGMSYHAIPWNGPGELTDEVFEASRTLLADLSEPTLLHCASANRVGAVLIPWRVLDGGISLDQAVSEARTVGMRSPEYEARARQYIAQVQATQ